MSATEHPSSDGGVDRASVLRLAVPLVLLVALALVWKLTPLSEQVTPEALSELAAPIRDAPWGPAVAACVIAVVATLMVPVTGLIVANALLFDTVPAVLSSVPGVLGSAVLGYLAGSVLWRRSVERISGERLQSIDEALARGGVLTVATIRLLPVAPFTVVNLVAGASKLSFRDYLAGTALTMVPGIAAMSVTADGIARAVRDPSPARIALSVGLVVVLVLGGHALRGWAQRRRSS